MSNLHKALETKSQWYKKWHSNPHVDAFNWVIFFFILTVSTVLISVRILNGGNPLKSSASFTSGNFIKAVDATLTDTSNLAIDYAYAPTIIKQGGLYHMWFCSVGEADVSWDYIRYSTSSDGVSWSRPVLKLKASKVSNRDLAACDPSVVYFKKPGEVRGYYYLFYSSAIQTSAGHYATVIQLARSETINGDFKYYTENGTWSADLNPSNPPKILIQPLNPEAGGYGAGQQILIAKDGKLQMWFTDDSSTDNPTHIARLYYLESTDPTNWSTTRELVDLPDWSNSNELKYDQAGNRYVMYKILNGQSEQASLQVGYSTDGLHWGGFNSLIPASNFPNFAHNSGFAGTSTGFTIPGPVLIGFGAPRNLSPTDTYGQWDLYVMSLAQESLDVQAPSISEVRSTQLTNNSFNISWTTDEFANSQIQYGLTNTYGSQTPLDTRLVVGHRQVLSGLTAGRTYHYQVMSRDASGNLARSADYTFVTPGPNPADTTPPQILSINTSILDASSSVVAWVTDELTDTVIQYGEAGSRALQTNSNPVYTTTHSVLLKNLKANTRYAFRIIAKDQSGNQTTSTVQYFTTNSVR